MDLKALFEKQPIQIREEEIKDEEEITQEPEQKPFVDRKLSVKQNEERKGRVLFIGNLPLKSSKKEIIKEFKKFGRIKKIWIRSLPVDNSAKLTQRGKIHQKKFLSNRLSKNCYLLYGDKESVKRAVDEMNNSMFEGRHLVVSEAERKERDFKTTIFVGNLHYDADEEELRGHFKECGQIDYVKIIRDKILFKSKGFGYVKFETKEGLQQAMILKKPFKNLELRIKKAKKSQLNSRKNNPMKNMNKKNAMTRLSYKELKEREEEMKMLALKNTNPNEEYTPALMKNVFKH